MKTIAPRVSAKASNRFLIEPALLFLVVGKIDGGHQVGHAAGSAEQGNGNTDDDAQAECLTPAGHQVDLVSDELLHLSRKCATRQGVDLRGDSGRVRDQAVKRHEREQGGNNARNA